ncbi:unnamed protein product, partial [Brassica napus]
CRLVLIQLAVTLKLRYICFYCSIECQSSDSFSVQSEKQSLLYEGVSTVPLNALPDFSTDSASCNIQASDTFASTVPLNANPVILPTVQSEKQVHCP